MTTITPADRSMPVADADERTMLVGWLDFHRVTLALKCAGLTDAQLKTASVAPSTLTLLGLVRHVSEVERFWFREVFAGEASGSTRSWQEATHDQFHALDEALVDEVFARWRGEQAHASKLIDRASTLDHASVGKAHGRQPSLRWILTHLIEEYARHNGHADLLREAIDGSTGF